MKLASHALIAAAAWLGQGAAHAQAQVAMDPATSSAAGAPTLRAQAAQHLYQRYEALVHNGPLPASLRGMAIVETTIGADGRIEAVEVAEAPADTQMARWLGVMIRTAAPFPVAHGQGKVTYRDVWMVTDDGQFMLESLNQAPMRHTAQAPQQ